MSEMRWLLPKWLPWEQPYLAILHALLASCEEKTNIPFSAIQAHRYVQMKWITSSVPWVKVPPVPLPLSSPTVILNICGCDDRFCKQSITINPARSHLGGEGRIHGHNTGSNITVHYSTIPWTSRNLTGDIIYRHLFSILDIPLIILPPNKTY